MFRLILLLLLPLLLSQCKTKDYLTPHEYEGRIINFGSGGGFTGKSTQYTLMENGQIFKDVNKEGNVVGIRKLKKAEVQQIFDNYDKLNFSNLRLNEPGNMYHFITMRSQGKDHKIMWGNSATEGYKELQLFHSILLNTVNKSRTDQSQKVKITK